jgi:hypothetical protein
MGLESDVCLREERSPLTIEWLSGLRQTFIS